MYHRALEWNEGDRQRQGKSNATDQPSITGISIVKLPNLQKTRAGGGALTKGINPYFPVYDAVIMHGGARRRNKNAERESTIS